MNASEYQEICSRPDVLPRGVIEATARRLSLEHHAMANRLRELLQGEPVPKPPRHDAGSHADYFVLALTLDELDEIVSALGDMEADLAVSSSERYSELSYAGELVDLWNSAATFRRDAA